MKFYNAHVIILLITESKSYFYVNGVEKDQSYQGEEFGWVKLGCDIGDEKFGRL